MVALRQGDICWAEAEGGRRPVLVVTRSEALPVLTRYIVAPITKTVRSIPTEILLGPDEGLDIECVASFDNLQPIRSSFLTARIGTLPMPRSQICSALSALADC